jgi:hypothetical protein
MKATFGDPDEAVMFTDTSLPVASISQTLVLLTEDAPVVGALAG